MKLKFNFETDNSSNLYCEDIIDEMISLFNISKEEAYERINKEWAGIKITGEDDPIYHELPDYWAKSICYGHDSDWWLNEKQAVIKQIK